MGKSNKLPEKSMNNQTCMRTIPAVCALLLLLSVCPTHADNLSGSDLDNGVLAVAEEIDLDPITQKQVEKAMERTFPDMIADPEASQLFKRILMEPSMRGNARGRLAEEDFLRRNVNDGWKKVRNPIAPHNDVWRKVNGKFEGGQIKVLKDWRQYLRSMRTDSKAEHFFIPHDHYQMGYDDLEARRLGALKGNDLAKSVYYTDKQNRLAKLGRSFSELDSAVANAAKNFSRIAVVAKYAGKASKALPYIGVALGILDGGICVYQVAQGTMSFQECIQHVGKAGVAGVASWGAASAIGTIGAPVAIVVVIGGATYFVADYAIDAYLDSFKTAPLTKAEIAMLWPKGLITGVGADDL